MQIKELRERTQSAAKALVDQSGIRPRIAMFLGTGHTEFTRRLDNKTTFHVSDIPDFHTGVEQSTLSVGSYAGLGVIIGDAPLAPYLGISGFELAFPIRVFRAMGCEFLILTAAAASLGMGALGDLGIVTDHLNFTHMNPLVGQNDELLGPRFPDMSEPYDKELSRIAGSIAGSAGFPVHEGVFAAIQGPSLPTRAEYRYLRSTGADFVGMSTSPEVIAAVHAGLRTLALLGITQRVDVKNPVPTDLESMVDAADLAAPRMSTVLAGIVETLARA
jgi:purine-nucleoside phosphorylase